MTPIVMVVLALIAGGQAHAAVSVPFPAGAMTKSGGDGMPLGWSAPEWARKAFAHQLGEDPMLSMTWPHAGYLQPLCRVPINPNWHTVVVTVRVRVQTLAVQPDTAGGVMLRVNVLNAGGNVLRNGDSPRIDRVSDWTQLRATVVMPEGASMMDITPGFFQASGAIDLAEATLEVEWRGTAPDPIPSAAVEVPALQKDAGQRDLPPAAPDAASKQISLQAPVAPLMPDSTWGDEPVVTTSSARSEIVLSGVWNFMPAASAAGAVSEGDFGTMRVPGSWKKRDHIPGLVHQGQGAAWSGVDLNTVDQAWYARSVKVPADWAGRAIVIDLERVSTDAVVFINGTECGRIGSDDPRAASGVIDVTSALEPGAEARIDVLVRAGLESEETIQMMGIGVGQQIKRKAELPVRGLIGDVILRSRPHGGHVSDVFVQPSVRDGRVRLTVELSAVEQAGAVQFEAQMRGPDGTVERSFSAEETIESASVQVVELDFAWPDPRLWDLDQPELYTLKLAVRGVGIADVYPQRFGFREFWIEGRNFMLNGSPFRLRPCVRNYHQGFSELIESQITADMAQGFNFQELWPSDPSDPLVFQATVARIADDMGWPISGIVLPVQNVAQGWSDDNQRQAFLRRHQREIRRLRNHPSILMWGSSGNYFGHEQDQNPRLIGRQDWIPERQQRSWQYGDRIVTRDIVAQMKHEDPTRPVFMHHGTHVGDFPSTNCYLNFIPLQEREEWLSAWAKDAELPWLAVEFGLPLSYSFMRNRGGEPVFSERLYTEYLAMLLGPEAYLGEPEDYRSYHRDYYNDLDGKAAKARDIPESFWPRGKWLHSHWKIGPGIETSAGYQKFIGRFVRDTWRSWRTAGSTSMPIPWAYSRAWSYPGDKDATRALPVFVPGTRGMWTPSLPQRLFWHLDDETATPTALARSVQAVNTPSMAWIAGPADATTAKDHAFWSGDELVKSIAVLNDSRAEQPFAMRWRVTIGDQVIAEDNVSGTVAVGATQLIPVQVQLPTVAIKTDAVISLEGSIGQATHSDEFALRVFPRHEPATGSLRVFDPVGVTSAMLTELGYQVQPWDGGETTELVIIGREALSGPLPGALDRLLRAGGRCLVMPQHPDFMRDAMGLRLASRLSRYVFPVTATHPVVAGLDATDLRNWAGASTLVESHPDYGTASQLPSKGWHWGNRGALTSAAIEKPHHAGWRPILECEFDLAYTPLMELDYGAGRMLWCALDLEDYVPREPAAVQLAHQLIRYAGTAPLAPRAKRVAVLASDREKAALDDIGLIYQAADTLDAGAELVIVGAEVAIDEAALEAYLDQGGRALFLARGTDGGELGLSLKRDPATGRGMALPDWPELSGLSISDLHTRAPMALSVVTDGADLAAGGLIARRQLGDGVAVFCQLAPYAIDCETQPWLRFTRWRQTRVVTQLFANLGGS
ncbi:MAG: hypothetical protein PF961_19140, partial [Planctomycetota bacterium]|nr:hypothetical protein [Planctomycetota bacterium]